MKTFIDKRLVLNRFKNAKNINSDKELAEVLGVSKSTLSNWIARDSLDYDLLFSFCEHTNLEWLLTGRGEMMKTDKFTKPVAVVSNEGIPLVEIEAVGGFGNSDFAINQTDILGRYQIPDFDQASFMIRVRGDSMSPRYSSGDLVACRVLRESKFIQWNEVHVIATREQGILIKRLRKGSNNKTLLAVSENTDYAPFEIPYDEIAGIALVLGGVRLE